MDSTLKRCGNGRFHVVSTWNPSGVFVGLFVGNMRVSRTENIIHQETPDTLTIETHSINTRYEQTMTALCESNIACDMVLLLVFMKMYSGNLFMMLAYDLSNIQTISQDLVILA